MTGPTVAEGGRRVGFGVMGVVLSKSRAAKSAKEQKEGMG